MPAQYCFTIGKNNGGTTMNKIRIIAILLAMLSLGFIIGFFSNGWLHHRRMAHFLQYRTEAGFRQAALEMLSPSPEQLDELNPIISEYARLNRDLNHSYRRDFDALQMSYFNELEPYLTEKQIDKLVGKQEPAPPAPLKPNLQPAPQRPDTGRSLKPNRPNSPITEPGQKIPDTANLSVNQAGDTTFDYQEDDVAPYRRIPNGPPGPNGPSPEERAERFSLTMKQRLFLDEPQYQQVRIINLDYANGMKTIHKKYKGVDYRSMMSEIASLDLQRNQQMKEVLTPAQYDRYLLMIERIKKAWVERRKR
jgi:hypothetical protein